MKKTLAILSFAIIRATMDKEKLREILRLKDSQHLMLNNPVGYKKE
jgi:hypothetical protein